jgi:hypothetical protein
MSQIDALLEERRGYVVRNLPERIAAVDAELARLGYAADPPVVETATVAPAENAAIKRGPGRPRKE